MELNILSIDIGIINLGMVFANIIIKPSNKLKNKIQNGQYNHFIKDIVVIDYNKIDITKMKHTTVSCTNCTLRHDRCIPDYVDHFIQEYIEYFNLADVILIERQPPVGITNVQDLLFTRFRDKVELVSPCSVHKYFNMSSDYDIRKQESELIAGEYLILDSFLRKHDIADAMLMIIYYYNKRQMDLKCELSDLPFEQFRLI